jgi:hypothetical protein
MGEINVYISNHTGRPDCLLQILNEMGGMGILRFNDDFRFLFLGIEGGYLILNHNSNSEEMSKVVFAESSQNNELIKKLVKSADQLFRVAYVAQADIYDVIFGAEQQILMRFPVCSGKLDKSVEFVFPDGKNESDCQKISS